MSFPSFTLHPCGRIANLVRVWIIQMVSPYWGSTKWVEWTTTFKSSQFSIVFYTIVCLCNNSSNIWCPMFEMTEKFWWNYFQVVWCCQNQTFSHKVLWNELLAPYQGCPVAEYCIMNQEDWECIHCRTLGRLMLCPKYKLRSMKLKSFWWVPPSCRVSMHSEEQLC